MEERFHLLAVYVDAGLEFGFFLFLHDLSQRLADLAQLFLLFGDLAEALLIGWQVIEVQIRKIWMLHDLVDVKPIFHLLLVHFRYQILQFWAE